MQFNVRYYDGVNKAVIDGIVDAPSADAARAMMAAKGVRVLSAKAVSSSHGRDRGFDVAWWCRELRTLLQAGMTVVEALETLELQSGQQSRRSVHGRLLSSLREGQSLSRAMQSQSVFPAVLVASVKASERTSSLVQVLDDYLRYDELMEALRKKAVSAAIYPGIVATLGALIALFLILYVIPRFSQVYVDHDAGVSMATRVLVGISRILAEHSHVVLGTVLVAAAVLAWCWRERLVHRMASEMLEHVAPLRRQWDHFRYARLYQSLALMFRGGYTLDESLAVCASLGLGERFAEGIHSAERDLMRGRSASKSFADAGIADGLAARLLAVGERTGSFDRVLQTVADRHAAAFSTFIERATRVVEPALLLSVALIVGGLVVLMYMPIFDMASTLQR